MRKRTTRRPSRSWGSGDSPETHQYRALCFLALGQLQDAERALEALISASPAYAVSDTDVPPRLVALFAQTRRRIMLAVVKRLFGEAREDFQAKEFLNALVGNSSRFWR